jgi:hypothetical protein
VPQPDDERLVDLEARLAHDDPRFAHALATGRPARPREYRRSRAWCVLAAGAALLITGVVLPDGLLIATGLVLSGMGVQLLDPNRLRSGRHGSPLR